MPKRGDIPFGVQDKGNMYYYPGAGSISMTKKDLKNSDLHMPLSNLNLVEFLGVFFPHFFGVSSLLWYCYCVS